MKFLQHLATLFCFLLLAVSCKKIEDLKNINSIEWNPNLASQVAYASFGVYDILATQDSSDLIIIDPVSGLIALNYKNEIASISPQDFAGLNDFSQNFSYDISSMDVPISVSFSGNAISQRNETIHLTVENGEEIKTVNYKSGTLNLNIQTNLKHSVFAKISFLDFRKNNQIIVDTVEFVYTNTIPQVSTVQLDLAGVSADFSSGGTTVNEARIQVETIVMGSGENILGNETFDVNFSSINSDFHNIIGYMGQQNIVTASDSVLIKIFQNATEGTFELANATVNFKIDNSFGVPIRLDLSNLKTINVGTGVETNLLNFPTSINVSAPSVIGQNSITNLPLDNTNTSNLSSLISPTPKYFLYEIDGTTNPNGQTGTDNFVDENSRCVITTEVSMPLDGLVYGFNIADTVDYDFKNQAEEIQTVMFRLITENGFPVKLGTQIRALDENNIVLFTLFDQPQDLIDPAPVNSEGIVTSSTKNIKDITLNEAQVDLLDRVKKFIIYGEASSTNYQNGVYVKFFDYYKINLKLGVQVHLKTTIN